MTSLPSVSGAIVGVGWALSLNNWMANSGGPIPAAIGYLMVLVILTPVALCYCELTPMLPVAGGGAAFAYRAFGETASIISGWAAFGAFIFMLPWGSHLRHRRAVHDHPRRPG